MRGITFLILLAGVVSLSSCLQKPKACINASDTDILIGESITFTSCSENDQSVSWNFGDGTTGSGSIVEKAFIMPGTYTVTITVTNKKGGSSAEVTVTVGSPPVSAAICSFTSSAYTGESVSFTSCSQNAVSLNWNFGDGGTANGASAVHTYSAAGTYTVRLIATGNDGTTDTATGTITITTVAGNFWNGYYTGDSDCSTLTLPTTAIVNISGSTITLNGSISGITVNLTGTFYSSTNSFNIPSQTNGGNTVSGYGSFSGNRNITFTYTASGSTIPTLNCVFQGTD